MAPEGTHARASARERALCVQLYASRRTLALTLPHPSTTVSRSRPQRPAQGGVPLARSRQPRELEGGARRVHHPRRLGPRHLRREAGVLVIGESFSFARYRRRRASRRSRHASGVRQTRARRRRTHLLRANLYSRLKASVASCHIVVVYAQNGKYYTPHAPFLSPFPLLRLDTLRTCGSWAARR